MALLVGVSVTIAILINVLFLQAGPHPAPMFKAAPIAAKPATKVTQSVSSVPRPRPVEATPVPVPVPVKASLSPPPRTPGEIINDIQRELARRGYYDGPIDGLYGPRTDSSIRDFEQTSGLKPSTEPSEALLQAIVRSPVKLPKATASVAARPPMPLRNDVAVERSAPSRRVIALQRALAEYGYGQIRPSGILDAETQAAIEKFERERRLPVTGKPSDRVVRELAAMTGRQLE
jgi:peptidoglycan hydrolase-like protein with peptidoglycan-binding domain